MIRIKLLENEVTFSWFSVEISRRKSASFRQKKMFLESSEMYAEKKSDKFGAKKIVVPKMYTFHTFQ